jgi:hypothetical protein
MRGISCVAYDVLASQEGLCSMEFRVICEDPSGREVYVSSRLIAGIAV